MESHDDDDRSGTLCTIYSWYSLTFIDIEMWTSYRMKRYQIFNQTRPTKKHPNILAYNTNPTKLRREERRNKRHAVTSP